MRSCPRAWARGVEAPSQGSRCSAALPATPLPCKAGRCRDRTAHRSQRTVSVAGLCGRLSWAPAVSYLLPRALPMSALGSGRHQGGQAHGLPVKKTREPAPFCLRPGPAGEHAAHPEVTTAGGRTASVVSCSSWTVRVSPWRVGAAHISKTVVIIPSLGGRLPFSFLSLPPESLSNYNHILRERPLTLCRGRSGRPA